MGERNVLTNQEPWMLAVTSGTTGKSCLIPKTRDNSRAFVEFGFAVGVYHTIFSALPQVRYDRGKHTKNDSCELYKNLNEAKTEGKQLFQKSHIRPELENTGTTVIKQRLNSFYFSGHSLNHHFIHHELLLMDQLISSAV